MSHGPGRQYIETPTATTPASGVDTESSNHPAIQARNILQLELGTSRSKGHERESILKSALQLVSSIADSHPPPDTITGNQSYSEQLPTAIPDSPPPEMLYMALQCGFSEFLSIFYMSTNEVQLRQNRTMRDGRITYPTAPTRKWLRLCYKMALNLKTASTNIASVCM